MTTNETRILIVDDDAGVRESLETILRYHKYDVATAPGGAAALDHLGRAGADLIFLDVKMPGVDGMEVLGRLHAEWPAIPVVMISGHGDIRMAIDTLRRGAEDFLEKPLDENRLLVVARNALQRRALARENEVLRAELDRELTWHGVSQASQDLTRDASRIARGDQRVLITGESGVGKELLARRIHGESPRRAGPFEVFACGSATAELVDDQLFGHVAGAFSGATRDHAGLFERARGGTLLLDEVAELSLDTQAKLLRVLESGAFRRLGDESPMGTDARIIATTHHDLRAEVDAGKFRQDLYYRLNVPSLRIPPLRERKEDIVPLASAFLAELSKKFRKPARLLDESAHGILTSRPWPGNARELRNAMEAMSLLCEDATLGEEQARRFFRGDDPNATGNPFDAPTFVQYRDAADRMYLTRQIELRNGNMMRTARELGIARPDLYRKLERLGLRMRAKGDGEGTAAPGP